MKRNSSHKEDKSEHLIIDAQNYFKSKDRSFRNGLVNGWDNILSIRVSKENLERAFKFYETLIDSLRLCEHKIVVENNDTIIIVNQEKFKVTLREKLKRIEITGRPDWDKYDYVPTGLFVFQWDYFKSKQWIDKQIKIEDQIPEIITWLETESFRIKEEKRMAKKAQEQYELERKVKRITREGYCR